jgi:hypothetical protein
MHLLADDHLLGHASRHWSCPASVARRQPFGRTPLRSGGISFGI